MGLLARCDVRFVSEVYPSRHPNPSAHPRFTVRTPDHAGNTVSRDDPDISLPSRPVNDLRLKTTQRRYQVSSQDSPIAPYWPQRGTNEKPFVATAVVRFQVSWSAPGRTTGQGTSRPQTLNFKRVSFRMVCTLKETGQAQKKSQYRAA